MHLNQEVFHAIHVGFFAIELNLERLASLVYTFVFGLLQSINLAKLCLLSFNLLLAELVNYFSQFCNPLLFFGNLAFRCLRLALVHEDLCRALFGLFNCSYSSCFLFIEHAAQLSGLSLSPLLFLLIKLFQLLVLTVFIDHCILQAMILVV